MIVNKVLNITSDDVENQHAPCLDYKVRLARMSSVVYQRGKDHDCWTLVNILTCYFFRIILTLTFIEEGK